MGTFSPPRSRYTPIWYNCSPGQVSCQDAIADGVLACGSGTPNRCLWLWGSERRWAAKGTEAAPRFFCKVRKGMNSDVPALIAGSRRRVERQGDEHGFTVTDDAEKKFIARTAGPNGLGEVCGGMNVHVLNAPNNVHGA